ncbi:MAG TPA: M20/M25/M40 family metallo-hydrolase [Vicinamibacterales bacterium]|nr:M20/M25/M40 family metallo-hydrolase [Vicinamibacterales bacterium]
MRNVTAMALAATMAATVVRAQPQPDWAAVEAETLTHFQALVRFDTSDPPGNEKPAADYVKRILEAEGMAVETFAPAARPERVSVVARLKGSGRRRPLLLMAHTDVVNVDPAKWTHPPFSAARDGGYVYGRGTVDDKDNVAISLMTMLLLKRLNVSLDRDVIFLAEAAEEGEAQYGIGFMTQEHFDRIDAEYCLAEGGGVTRVGGVPRYASVQTLEKLPFNVQLVARGPAGHGSTPLQTNAVVRLSQAVTAVANWASPVRLNETTSAYFRRLAEISPPEQAARYRAVLDPAKIQEIDAYFREHEPRHASMLRTSLSPNIIDAGYRINVIPSEARATVDTRALPDEDMPAFLDQIRKVVNDPAVEVSLGERDVRPPGREARIDSEVFKAIEAAIQRHYQVPTLPTMSTGATDMAFLRARGMQCYGVGPATDSEDGGKGFGAHSDQERILESELHRFMRYYWDVVTRVARAQG